MDSALELLELDELTVLANLDLEANNLTGAMIKLKLAISKGGSGELLVMLARLYARLGLFERAKPLFAQYLQENPGAMIERFQYGMTFFDSNDLEQAGGVFSAILEQEPGHPPALFYSSLVQTRMGKLDAAVKQLEKIIASVDEENLFYQRALEQLKELDPARADEPGRPGTTAHDKPTDARLN